MILQENILLTLDTKVREFERKLDRADRKVVGLRGSMRRASELAAGFLSANVIQGALSGLGQLATQAFNFDQQCGHY